MDSQVHIHLNLSLNFKPRFEILKPRFENFHTRFERKSAHLLFKQDKFFDKLFEFISPDEGLF